MVLYVEGDVVQYRPFGGDVKTGTIEKIESKTGGHVSLQECDEEIERDGRSMLYRNLEEKQVSLSLDV